MRGAWMGLCLGLAWSGVALGCTVPPHVATQMPDTLSAPYLDGSLAWYDGPTTRYTHGVLGDTIEATRLHAYATTAQTPCGDQSISLPPDLVFEDTTPRLADMDGDGTPEIIVVQSHQRLGAQLAVYRFSDDGVGLDLLSATPFIGRPNRWLSPIGIADLDGDGRTEIAYIDRPHLARTLRVWRYLPDHASAAGLLQEVASLPGLTNHRIGQDFISGGIRTCNGAPEMITANADWTLLIATRLSSGALTSRAIGPFSPSAMTAALSCSQ
ncbi:VCBS repeat-containing protein [Gymnodinialimonas sp. 57CJ19]|uniref:FG-GAP repeat domain-containing protein n=1 Tax=Gymnodinialimonas sp. 57CJ19 TaxID=3138498 RepID=UPI0031344F9B